MGKKEKISQPSVKNQAFRLEIIGEVGILVVSLKLRIHDKDRYLFEGSV
jgi:hypothetical protein